MPACTPDRGNRTPTLSPPSCDLTTLTGAKLATMPAPRPLATKRRVTPFLLACVLRLMRFLLGVRVFVSVRPSMRCLLAVRHAAGATGRGQIFRTRGEGGRGGTWGARARALGRGWTWALAQRRSSPSARCQPRHAAPCCPALIRDKGGAVVEPRGIEPL